MKRNLFGFYAIPLEVNVASFEQTRAMCMSLVSELKSSDYGTTWGQGEKYLSEKTDYYQTFTDGSSIGKYHFHCNDLTSGIYVSIYVEQGFDGVCTCTLELAGRKSVVPEPMNVLLNASTAVEIARNYLY